VIVKVVVVVVVVAVVVASAAAVAAAVAAVVVVMMMMMMSMVVICHSRPTLASMPPLPLALLEPAEAAMTTRGSEYQITTTTSSR
jgi:hypothetical protein